MLTINLLGAPDILWHETRLDLPRRQARALLYCLAADPRPVPREQLIYLFWPDVPDTKARKNLSRLASFLRGSLPEPGQLTPGKETIGLDASCITCDVRDFIGLLDDGDADALEQAVTLYRGTFLSGFRLSNAPEFENWAILESERLERRFLNALARLIEIKSSSGDLSSAVRYGQRYLSVDNLAEEIHRQLITLYVMSGDRASALRQYELCVATLERELGVAPLPETRAAYEAALADQTTAASLSHDIQPAISNWTVLPSLELPLIGRDAALLQLEQAFEQARSGGFIFISGEPGVGKSRLLQEFAGGRHDSLVLVGNGYESARDLPYQPIVQALRPALGAPDLWQRIRPIWLAEVAAILPDVAEHFEGLPSRVEVDPEQAQARLFEAMSQVILGLADQRPLLLCLDDLHWADAATLAYLTYLVSRLPASEVCIVATFRTQEAEPLGDLRQTLRRASRPHHITLSGLAIAAIAAILDQIPATSDRSSVPSRQPLAAAIYRATAGNTFFVLETIRYLIEHGHLEEPPTTLPLPPTVQEVIRGRLKRLDPLSRQILEAAAITSPDISFELLGPVAGRTEDETVKGLEALISRQLLAGSGEDLQFQHELARVVVYEDLSHWRRRLLHRRTAEALADRNRGRQDQTAAQIARHFEAAGEIDLACSFYRDAANVAQSLYAYREANHYLQRIIDLQSQDAVEPQITGRLYESLADNLRAMAHFDAAESAYRRALEITPDEPTLWRADVLRKVAAVIKPELRFEEADDLYSLALELIDRSPADPQVDKRRSWLRLQFDRLDLYYGQARLDDMVKLTAEVEAVVKAVDEPFHWSQYYAAMTRMRAFQERFAFSPETVQIGRERLRHATKANDVREVVEQQFGLGFVLLWAGEVNEADEALQRALSGSEEIGHTFIQIQCLTYLSIAHRYLGDTVQAEHYLRRSEGITRIKKHRYYVGVDHSTRAWLSYRNSDWNGAVEQAQAALAQWQNTIYPFAWLANWIILAYGLETADLALSFEAAADMLRPDQQRLPDDITAALTEAVAAIRSGDEALGRTSLTRARELAETLGYL